MTIYTKSFGSNGKYKAVLDTRYTEDTPTECFINFGRYTASLSCLMGVGVLESPNGNIHSLEGALIDDIYEWAIEHGY